MEKKIKQVWLDETENDCTSCGVCESIAPDVFEVVEKMFVLENADLTLIEDIEQSADICPVSTIAINYSGERNGFFYKRENEQ